MKGKIAVVTGATRGIGRAVAERLAKEGAWVVICGRDQAAVDAASGQISRATAGRVTGWACDVSKWEAVEAFFARVRQEFGGVDLLVNNAGAGIFKPVDEMTPEEWRTIIDLNLTGTFYCTRASIELLRARGGGYIVNISSLAGKNAFAGGSAYNASKFGVNGFSEAIMQDLRYDNIRVSYVMPGSVDTGFGGAARADWKIAPEDIAETVMALWRMPERSLISRVEIRPSKPPKK